MCRTFLWMIRIQPFCVCTLWLETRSLQVVDSHSRLIKVVCCSEHLVDTPTTWSLWSSNSQRSWTVDRRDHPKTASDNRFHFITSKRLLILRMALEVGVCCLFACPYQRTTARRNLVSWSCSTADLGLFLTLNYCCEHRTSRFIVFQLTDLLSAV